MAALLSPEAYPPPVEKVSLVETHISSVFLTGEYVYKLKRPVNYGFLDFTSLEKRERFCREEHRLNSRLAPEVYLGVKPVTREGGRIRVDGPGEVIDWLVVMRQLDEATEGRRVVAEGRLTPEMIDRLIRRLVPFYARAATGPGIDDHGRVEAVRFNAEENFSQIEPYLGLVLSRERLAEISGFTESFLKENEPLFRRRVEQGRIREGHGDLHLGNIYFTDPPTVIDCLEFNIRLRAADPAADLAFLAMDLDFHGRPELTERLVAGFAAASGDEELPRLMGFYKCYRACVRGKISAFTWDLPEKRGPAKEAQFRAAKRYFQLAWRYAGGRSRPALVVLHGLMGSGKSALGRWLFARYGWPVISSDMLRKKLAGLPTTAKVREEYGRGLYSAGVSDQVYRAMHDRAADLLAAGQSVILDGSYQRRAHRQEALELARRGGARLLFLKTVCQEAEQARRLAARQGRKLNTDGRLELMAAQRADYDPPGPEEKGRLLIIPTDGSKAQTRELAERGLKEHGLAG